MMTDVCTNLAESRYPGAAAYFRNVTHGHPGILIVKQMVEVCYSCGKIATLPGAIILNLFPSHFILCFFYQCK